MFKKRLVALAAVAILLVTAQTALAENGKEGMVLNAMNEVDVVVVNEKGEQEIKRVDAAEARVLPGDAVFFTVRYENAGKNPATDIVITNPVPEHMLLTPLSTYGDGTDITFSIDNGKSFHKMEDLVVIESDGTKRPPKPKEYTHVRWSMQKGIMPDQKGSVGFTATVE